MMKKKCIFFVWIYWSIHGFHHPSHLLSFFSSCSTLQSHLAEKLWSHLTASEARADRSSPLPWEVASQAILTSSAPLTRRATKLFPCLSPAGIYPRFLALLKVVQGLNRRDLRIKHWPWQPPSSKLYQRRYLPQPQTDSNASANLDVSVESGVSAWILLSCKPQCAMLPSMCSNPIANTVPCFHNF